MVWIKEQWKRKTFFVEAVSLMTHLSIGIDLKGPGTKMNAQTHKLIEITQRQQWLSLLMVSNQHVCQSEPLWRCAVLCVRVFVCTCTHLFLWFVCQHLTDFLHISVQKTGIIKAHVCYCVLYQADKPIGAQPLMLILPHWPLPPPLPWLSFNGRIHSVMTWKSGRRSQPGCAKGVY